MKTKDYILCASVIINIILGYWIYDMTKDDQKPNEDLFRSKGRVEVLEGVLLEKDSTINILELKNDSLDLLLAKKPKERIVIKKVYDEEITNVINLPIDSSVSFLAGRLSQVNSNR